MPRARVLLVEDEAVLRSSLASLLRNRGYEVMEAAGPGEAVATAASGGVDVVIADLMLRDRLSGLDVVDLVRARLPEVRVVLITGFPSDQVRADAALAGVAAFLEKPFTIQQLAAAIDPDGGQAPD